MEPDPRHPGERAYLDWNATAPLRPEARTAVAAALDLANPSSVHAEGRAAHHAIERAREQVAALVGAEPRNVTFTSGGTEANALALGPRLQDGADKRPMGRLLLSAIEHASVRSGSRFPSEKVEELPVTPLGIIDIEGLRQRLAALAAAGSERPLVSVMHANNETGAVQPIAEAAAIVHAAGGLLHVDAVQSVGRILCDISDLGADLLTLSSHKIGGPKGAGALVRRSAELHLADPLLKGGGQERGGRGGTENVPGIVGFGAAAQAAAAALAPEGTRMAALRERLEAGLTGISPQAVVFAAAAPRLPNTTLFAVPGIKAETALIALDLSGVAVSSGSACSSGKVTASHVLAAMGVPAPLAAGAVRVSIGPTTTDRDIDLFLWAWSKLAKSLSRGGTRGLAA